MTIIEVFHYLSGTQLPDHLVWIEQLLAYGFVFALLLSILKFFRLVLQGK